MKYPLKRLPGRLSDLAPRSTTIIPEVLTLMDLDEIEAGVLARRTTEFQLHALADQVQQDVAPHVVVKRVNNTVVAIGNVHILAATALLGRTNIQVRFCDEEQENKIRIAEAEVVICDAMANHLQWCEAIYDVVRAHERNAQGLDKFVQPDFLRHGAISAAVEQLPILAKSKDGRRKRIERAINVARLHPDAKAIAEHLSLSDTKSALRAAAEETTREAQIAALHRWIQERTPSESGDPSADEATSNTAGSGSAESDETATEDDPLQTFKQKLSELQNLLDGAASEVRQQMKDELLLFVQGINHVA